MGNHRSLLCSKCSCIWQEQEKYDNNTRVLENIAILESLKVFSKIMNGDPQLLFHISKSKYSKIRY